MGNAERRVPHWEFIHRGDGTWVWRHVRKGEVVAKSAGLFVTYGRAVWDALGHGFRPTEDHWTVSCYGGITYYAPGKEPITCRPLNPRRRRSDNPGESPQR